MHEYGDEGAGRVLENITLIIMQGSLREVQRVMGFIERKRVLAVGVRRKT